jgi:hypothetical protein
MWTHLSWFWANQSLLLLLNVDTLSWFWANQSLPLLLNVDTLS